jgi:two-component system OmpR family sensor kinase
VSLRARLGYALGILAGLLVVSVVIILRLVQSSLVGQIDRQLAATARIADVPIAGQLPSGSSPAPQRDSADAPFSDLFLLRYDTKGHLTTLVRPSNKAKPPHVDFAAARRHATSSTGIRAFDAHSADGSSGYRVVAVNDASRAIVLISLPTGQIDTTFQRVRLGVILVTSMLFAAVGLAGWWVERLGIRPIKRVTDAATAIARGDLTHRVELAPPSTEAGRLARAFNVMVDERQAAEEQLRRFVADASHELRTPLATIAGVFELHNSGLLPPGTESQEALRRGSREAARMASLVDDLLLLAELDQGRPILLSSVDLGPLLTDAAFDAALVARDRTVTTDIDPNVVVLGEEQKLRQIIANLASNALTHTPAAGHVMLRAYRTDDACVIEVSDDGPGMTAEEAAQVFHRFYRADTARSRTSGGSGLGLSIVASLVMAHRGDVTVETAPGKGAIFRVVLPAAPAEG